MSVIKGLCKLLSVSCEDKPKQFTERESDSTVVVVPTKRTKKDRKMKVGQTATVTKTERRPDWPCGPFAWWRNMFSGESLWSRSKNYVVMARRKEKWANEPEQDFGVALLLRFGVN